MGDYIGHKALQFVLANFEGNVALKTNTAADYITDFTVSIKQTPKFKDGTTQFVYIKITQDLFMQALNEDRNRANRADAVAKKVLPTVAGTRQRKNTEKN